MTTRVDNNRKYTLDKIYNKLRFGSFRKKLTTSGLPINHRWTPLGFMDHRLRTYMLTIASILNEHSRA